MTSDFSTVFRGRINGDVVRTARVRKGWTREHLAVAIGYSAQSVMNWELGKSSPQPDTIIMIADALGVEPADLMLEY